MDINECLSSMKNLEGSIDVDSCIKFAVMLSSYIPKHFLVNSSEGKENKKDSYIKRPWEASVDSIEASNNKVFKLSVSEMLQLDRKPLIIDIRSEKE